MNPATEPLPFSVKLARLRAWEFWPSWAVYAPLVPWWIWLGLRHGGLTTCTAANPALPMSGLVGESKYSIIRQIGSSYAVASCMLDGGSILKRMRKLRAWQRETGSGFPIILKPDVGERGAGVRLVRSRRAAAAYLVAHRVPIVAQEFHAGPLEAGVLYWREPGSIRGNIFSVTDKVFPKVVGDGKSSIRELIVADTRLRLQAHVFFKRIGDQSERVPFRGEIVQLAVAGNHCQGTLFRDGQHLATPALSRALDKAVATFDGFCFGRFDLRYSDPEALRRGEGFKIIELNGLLSESTNIYDPSYSYFKGQRYLRRQWEIAYRLGAMNRDRGATTARLSEVIHAFRSHVKRPEADHESD